jgi:lactoylglutathione lyase
VIYEFNHYGIVIRNLEKSLAFYQGLLGAKEVYRGFIPPTKTDVVYLLITGGMIELLHRADPPADEKFGTTHIAFMSNDLDADYDRIVAAGYKGLVKPKVAGSGVGRLAFVEDPNGARVELIQRDVRMRDTHLVHPIVRSFDHYNLAANNLDAALKFYVDTLGMKVLKKQEVPATGLRMVYLNYDYDVLELACRTTPTPADQMYGHYALRVDNVDEALKKFAAQGVPTELGFPRPAGTGLGRIGMIRDPDGVKIELVDRKDLRSL